MKEWNEIPEIELFTDGGAEPNPGNGGFGVILSYKGRKKEISKGYRLTTNNRMELLAVIIGLEALKTKSKVQIFSDSKYVIEGIEKGWAKKWQANNWFRTKKNKAVNSDLWTRLLAIIEQHDVNFTWVKGHSGHIENERCDELASMAMKNSNLLIDEIFEALNPNIDINQITSKTKQAYSDKSIKIEKEGDLCRKCNISVEKVFPKRKKIKNKQSFYFEYYLLCPQCKTYYYVDDAKREISRNELFE